ncbi:MAG: hypothetical protein ABJH04_14005 [Cyclobacteriaceae bacterium]
MTHAISEPMMLNVTKGVRTILIALLLLLTIPSFSQENHQNDSLFIVTYTTGPAWDFDKTPNDQLYFSDHSQHLSALRKNGTIKLGARAGEKGIIVFSAKTLQKAREIINNDIAIINGLFRTEIQPFNVFYPGCIER